MRTALLSTTILLLALSTLIPASTWAFAVVPLTTLTTTTTTIATTLTTTTANQERQRQQQRRTAICPSSRVRLYAAAEKQKQFREQQTPSAPGVAVLEGLKVAIVGAGPSGLLLAHKLVQNGAAVQLYEARSRPSRTNNTIMTTSLSSSSSASASASLSSRAYALGVGMRGRTAIQSASQELWQAVKNVGFASERFIVYGPGPLRLKLRDGDVSAGNGGNQEPSVLLYQTDLCCVLAEQLETVAASLFGADDYGNKLKLFYDTKVTNVDLSDCTLDTISMNRLSSLSSSMSSKFDLIVGCDGVNSVVRKAILETWPRFESTQTTLEGNLKVVRLSAVPPKLDPTAVGLILPKEGTCTAFVEPTGDGGCCVLFAGRNASDPILASSSMNVTELQNILPQRFPLLFAGNDDDDDNHFDFVQQAAQQLAYTSMASKASSVVCNTYHYDNKAVLVGDAAHATGGVSGQGVNSALQDSKVLADSLVAAFARKKTPDNVSNEKLVLLRQALLSYSQQQVPEGHALYDLSFGPRPKSVWKKLAFAFTNARDSVFRGQWGIGQLPLQTLLTTSLVPFSEIRRDSPRACYYDDPFPTAHEWDEKLTQLHINTTSSSNNSSNNNNNNNDKTTVAA